MGKFIKNKIFILKEMKFAQQIYSVLTLIAIFGGLLYVILTALVKLMARLGVLNIEMLNTPYLSSNFLILAVFFIFLPGIKLWDKATKKAYKHMPKEFMYENDIKNIELEEEIKTEGFFKRDADYIKRNGLLTYFLKDPSGIKISVLLIGGLLIIFWLFNNL